jgi:hypothetical protein
VLAGLAAERVIYGEEVQLDESDEAKGLAAARVLTAASSTAASQSFTTLVPPVGELIPLEPDPRCQPAPADLIEREAQRVVEACLADAKLILRRHHEELVALAAAVRSKRTLGLSELRGIVTGASGRSERAPLSEPAPSPTSSGKLIAGRRRRRFRLLRWSGLQIGNLAPAPAGAAPALTDAWTLLRGFRTPALAREPAIAAPLAPVADLAPVAELAPRRHASQKVLTRSALVRYWALAAIWGVVTVAFWAWWLHHSSHATAWLYWLQTTMLFYQTTLLPTIYWASCGRWSGRSNLRHHLAGAWR